MKHLKIKIMSIALLAAATSSMAQSLDKMNWLNEYPPRRTSGEFPTTDLQWTMDLFIMPLMAESSK